MQRWLRPGPRDFARLGAARWGGRHGLGGWVLRLLSTCCLLPRRLRRPPCPMHPPAAVLAGAWAKGTPDSSKSRAEQVRWGSICRQARPPSSPQPPLLPALPAGPPLRASALMSTRQIPQACWRMCSSPACCTKPPCRQQTPPWRAARRGRAKQAAAGPAAAAAGQARVVAERAYLVGTMATHSPVLALCS